MNPAKPTNLKVLEGNPGKRRIRNEPNPSTENIKCPTWLDKEAKKKWKQIEPELRRLGLLTCLDVMALAVYCTLWSEFITVKKLIELQGLTYMGDSGLRKKNPLAKHLLEVRQQLMSYAREFGFTPASRTRLGTFNDDHEELQSLDEFLARKQKRK